MYCNSANFKYLLTFTIISFIASILIVSIGSVQEADARCLGELSGVWVGNDGATYYIQQNGQKVWWVGGTTYNEGTTFVNVFFGQRSGDSIHGNWADVPLGKYRGNGEITLVCSQNVHNYILTKTDSTGGFSGSVWEKYR